MARGVNKVILIGNLGQNPETSYTQQGVAITKLSLATSQIYKDTNGQKQERTDWHNVVFFGRLAEICQQILIKGSKIYVEGALRTNKVSNPQTGQNKYYTNVNGREMQLLAGGAPNQNNQGNYQANNQAPPRGPYNPNAQPQAQPGYQQQPQAQPHQSQGGGFDNFDDDIPF